MKSMAFLKPVTCNCYENAVRYNNLNCSPVCNGFTADTTSVMQPVVMDDNTVVYGSEVRDVFKNGWTASEKGASITFRLTGTEIGVMYRKSVQKPAPVAYAVLDGDVKNRFRLDANFEEDWGDKAYMETLLYHGGVSGGTEHTLTVVIEEEGSASDFYLINVIVSGVGSGDEGKIS